MSTLLELRFPFQITCHAFNGDNSKIALCPNNNEIHIYGIKGNKYTQEHILTGHDIMVTSLDWAPNTNRIVSCSQDKNAYVWTFDSSTNKWGPTLVHLRVDRAAIQVRWSPNEQKFAVASGSSSVAICYFGEDNNWWVSKHLKKSIASSVLSISWHPNSVLIVCGGADMVTRVFSTFIKGIDERPAPSVWGERLPFGTLCGEYESEYNGWIHSASFSPDGNQIAFVAHDSTLSIVDPVNNSIYSIQSPTVPHYQLSWVSPDKIIVSGQQPCPTACKLTSSGWEFSKETAKKGTGRPTTPRDRDSPLSRSSAFNIFRQMDSRASAVFSGDGAEEEHENGSAISELRMNTFMGSVNVSTTTFNGKVSVWDVSTL